jgi:hypothetical protein
MRDMDDKIIYSLNTSLPTESIKLRTGENPGKNCQELYEKLKIGYAERDKVIKQCILITADQVKELKKQKEIESDNTALEKKFKSEQRKVSSHVYRDMP